MYKVLNREGFQYFTPRSHHVDINILLIFGTTIINSPLLICGSPAIDLLKLKLGNGNRPSPLGITFPKSEFFYILVIPPIKIPMENLFKSLEF
jgi:hypothetical protein